jgi:16S rRNA (cytosine967-C5)-methyltransferase
VSGAASSALTLSARALRLIALDGRSADAVLKPGGVLAASVQAITLGTLRWYWRLDALLTTLLGPTKVTPPVRALLLVALHQLDHSRNPPEATVSSAVDAVRQLGQPRASGLVNALLRRYLREKETLSLRALGNEAASSAHPAWLLQALRRAWPGQWQSLLELNNTQAPMTLRVNLARSSRAEYQERLTAANLPAHAPGWAPGALVLERPTAVQALPGFADGMVSVQDAGAQLASVLLGALPGERVLDACAAPGGKTGAILEAARGELRLTAADSDADRLQRVAENLSRLQLHANLVCADLGDEPNWWDGQPFDRILVDAPCSGTGVIRRHPDIKVLRRQTDIAGFAATQRRILERTLRLLKPGGRLIYSTCSLLAEENECIVAAVLHDLPQAQSISLPDLPGDCGVAWPPQTQSCGLGMQLLPTNEAPTDGFYYAGLTVS